MRARTVTAFAVLLVTGLAAVQPSWAQTAPGPDRVLTYGDAPSQKVEVFLPDAPASTPTPVVVFISGGCYVTRHGGPAGVRPVLDQLARDGVAVWSVGYRRTDENAAFPDLFNDVATAIDLIKVEGPKLAFDLDRVVFVGHSAGGHFALWAAGRDRLPPDSPLRRPDPVRPDAVVAIAGPVDIEPLRQVADDFCGPDVFDRVMGVPTPARPDVFADASPSRLLPLGVPVRLITGSEDALFPPAVMHMFEGQIRAAGDDVTLHTVPDTDHIEVVTPGQAGWEAVRRTTLDLLGVESRP